MRQRRTSIPLMAAAAILAGVLASLCPHASLGQDFTAPPQIQLPSDSGTRQAFRPTVPNGVVTKSAIDGTYVALASGLTDIFSGKEPTTLDELKALNVQQSKVAEIIEGVTVNVQQGSAQGSGVIITEDGYILTAAHVAGGAGRQAEIVLGDGRRFRAKTLGLNRSKDAGLIKIEAKNPSRKDGKWPHATLGRSSKLRVGQWCIAAGHPGGWKAGRGSVIRVGRVLEITKNRGEKTANTLTTDCALIGGDSGGPLFTLEGKLIGIHSRIGTEVEDNMHVPIDVYAESWDRMAKGEVWGVLPGFEPAIGVVGISGEERPLIKSVAPQGPAETAGIEPGDLIVRINGVKIGTFAELRMAVKASTPGDQLTLIIKRNGQLLKIPVIVGVRSYGN